MDKYELLEEIGHGGMATVYRALDRRLGREVGVKLIHRHLRENTEVAARFVAEARAVARLRHPNIVDVYDISDELDAERYLVVELVRGPTLRQVIAEHGALPPELAAAIGLQLASALAHAHAEGVIHRDIKPENVLIATRSGNKEEGSVVPRVKLTDFGIAKLLDAQGVTSTGQVLGSPAHMAPEQIEGGQVDARSDVFALGVLLYECMTGKLPFDGKNPAQVLRGVLDGTFEPADKVRPEVGARYSGILRHALAREPEGRYPTVTEFAQALEAALLETKLEDPPQELTDFFREPKGYLEGFPHKIGVRLLSAGSDAKAARRISDASALFNRALVYLPGDPEALRQVSGLAKRRRVFEVARWGAVVAAACLVLGVAAYFAQGPTEASTGEQAGSAPRARPVARQAAQTPPEIEPTPPVPAEETETTQTPVRRKPVRMRPTEVKSGVERDVSVRIVGATGGRLRVDGQEREWFGRVIRLPVGEHQFDFVPPNESCCVAASQRILIKEGEGVQRVVGQIAFKEATVQVVSSLSGRAQMACPTLFFGEFTVPGSRKVPMSRSEVSERCTITPSDQASPPVQKLVTLRAGQTTVIPWR